MKAVALATKVPAALSTSLGWALLRRGSAPCAAAGDDARGHSDEAAGPSEDHQSRSRTDGVEPRDTRVAQIVGGNDCAVQRSRNTEASALCDRQRMRIIRCCSALFLMPRQISRGTQPFCCRSGGRPSRLELARHFSSHARRDEGEVRVLTELYAYGHRGRGLSRVVGTVSERLGSLPVKLDASIDRTVQVALPLQCKTELKIPRFCIDLPEAGRRQHTLPTG